MTERAPEIDAVRRLLMPSAPERPNADSAWIRFEERRRRRLSRGRQRRRRALALGIASATLAVAVPVVTTSGPTVLPEPSSASAAERVMSDAARAMRREAPLGAGDVRVVRVDAWQLVTEQDASGHWHGYVLPRRWEQRFGIDGGSRFIERADGRPRFAEPAAARSYVRAFGPYEPAQPKPPTTVRFAPDAPNPDLLGLSAQGLRNLPTDPDALGQRLRELTLEQPGDMPQDVAGAALRLLVFGPTPPRVRAALAEVLGRAPGVGVVGPERFGGRPAFTLVVPAPDPGGRRLEVVVDARAGDVLAERTRLTRADPSIPGSHRGTIVALETYRNTVASSLTDPVQLRPVRTPSRAAPVPPPGP